LPTSDCFRKSTTHRLPRGSDYKIEVGNLVTLSLKLILGSEKLLKIAQGRAGLSKPYKSTFAGLMDLLLIPTSNFTGPILILSKVAQG
jgi:hypothetical protein